MPALATLQAEMVKFMVPVGPNGDELPQGFVAGDGGWPDNPPAALPSPITGVSVSPGVNNFTLVAAGLVPGALVGGFATIASDANIPGGMTPPAGFLAQAAEIAANGAATVTLVEPVGNGAPDTTVVVAAGADDQVLFNVGVTNVGLVLSVRRLSPAANGAVDATVIGHNPAAGQIGIGALTPPIQTGHQVEFVFKRQLAGGIPAGRGYSLVPARAPPGGAPPPLTVGQAWSEAYGAFFGQATPAPAPGSYSAAIQAMRTTMDSLSAIPGMGAVSFTAGMVAFWGVVAASAPAIFSSVPSTLTVVPPPGIFAVGLAIAAATAPSMLPAFVPPLPEVGPGWTPAHHNAVITLMATAIMAASQGAQIIAQPGPAPVPTPIVFA